LGGADGLAVVLDILGGSSVQVLVITDEDSAPWQALRGTLSDLVDVLRHLPFVEYFLVDESFERIVFETHHQCIVAAGELPPEMIERFCPGGN